MKNHHATTTPLKNSCYPTYEQLQQLFDASLDVICSLDAEGRFIYVSNAAKHLWGYEPQELIGRSCRELIVAEDLERTELFTRLMVEDGQKVTNFENRYYKKDGTVIPMLWSAQWDERTKQFNCIARDGTEKKEAEAQKEKYNREVAAVLERIQDCFFALDHNFRVTYWNKKSAEILSIPREIAIHKDLRSFFPEEAYWAFYKHYYEAMALQQPVHFEATFLENNSLFEVHAYPSADGLSVFFRDITLRKQTELELQKLSLVARQTDNIVAISGADRKIVWVNDAFSRVTGYSYAEAIGADMSTVFDGPETDPKIIQLVKEKVALCQPFRIEVLNYKKNGDTYWAEVACQPVFDKQGELLHFFSIATDITERKMLQQVLDQEKQQRQQMITAVAIKIQEHERAQVSRELHDNVNQVLTTVKLYQELCRDGIGDAKDLVNKSIGLLQDSINEIRSLSKRLSAPSLGNLKLKESVAELIDTIAVTNKLNIVLEASGIDDLEADQEVHLAVYRILQEQLTNILKHAEARSVQVRLRLEGDVLTLKVRDDGKGFDPKQKRNGIGITNMTTRAESVRGRLSICSQPGCGCEVVVTIVL